MLWEIVERAAAQFLAVVEPIAHSEQVAPDKLRAMVRAHVEVVADNLDDATIFLHEWKYLGEERRAEVRAQRDRYESLYREVIEHGVETGKFAPCDPKMGALLVLSTVNWLPQWYNPDGPLTAAEVADRFSDMVLRGLEPR